MNKQLLFFILGLTFFSFSIHAQTPETTTKRVITAEEAGNVMCDCINDFMDDLHPQVKTLMKNIDLIGMEEAQTKFMNYIEENPDEAEKIMVDAVKMQSFDQSIAKIESCKTLNELVSDQSMQDNPNLEKELGDFLKTKSKCEYAYIFYKLGAKQ